jgi:RNA polymerase-binding transcription factor DksA
MDVTAARRLPTGNLRSMELDLDVIETDLADVEVALARLESGQYWTCEITGQPLSDELLAARPTARRLPGN